MTTVRQRYQLIPSKNIADQRMLKFDRTRRIPDHTQTNVIVLDTILPEMIISMKKIKNIYLLFPVILLIKESCNLTESETQLARSNQKW